MQVQFHEKMPIQNNQSFQAFTAATFGHIPIHMPVSPNMSFNPSQIHRKKKITEISIEGLQSLIQKA